MKKIKAQTEGRNNIWIPEKTTLKEFIKSRKLKKIHNFIPCGMMILGADHSVDNVLADIDRADRLAIFTDETANMGHSLSLIYKEKLECYDIGKINKDDIILTP